MNKIEQFIENNSEHIDIKYLQEATKVDSSVNGMCVILAGYHLHLTGGDYDFSTLKDQLSEASIVFDSNIDKELKRVYDYAHCEAYEEYWKTEEAKRTYKF